MPLTDVVLRKIKPGPKTVRMADEKGLYLEVSPSGGTWWRLKYRFDGKEKRLALGVYPEVSLKEARDKRDEARDLLRDGIDPSANRKARKTAEAKAGADSFEVVAREWHVKFSPTWDSVKYRDITLRRLELNVFPWLGKRPIAEITPPELLTVIQRIEKRGAIDTAHRILGLCGQILRFAIATSRAERDVSQDIHDALICGDDPFSGMAATVMDAAARLERRMIGARTKAALGVKKAKGEKTRGSIPFGFSLAADGVHLEPHPVEHPVLVRILTLRRAGLGGRRIAATLTAEGHQPRGVAWNPGNLQVLADRLMAEGMGLGRAGTSTCTTPRTPTARSSGGRFSPTTATSRLAASPRVCSCIFP
jgi:hypothetical protein